MSFFHERDPISTLRRCYLSQVSPLSNLQTITWYDENIFYRRRIVYFAVIFKNTNNLVLGSQDTF